MNFLVGVDGSPQITVIAHSLCEDVTPPLPAKTADHPEDDTKRLIWLFVQLKNIFYLILYFCY